LLVEACATGKPVEDFEWSPRRRSPSAAAAAPSPAGYSARIRSGLVYAGLIKPRRDFDAYHRALRERGLITRLGERASAEARPLDDMERAVARIRSLFGGPEASELQAFG